ncbi:DUF692 domain-containing protein [Paracoccus liaowanqingii]|uniref:UPF0276 protein E4L95_20760 n=2 Tax=Paracoccus liaowanqingii TaxID=2560053 RepID=A0A4Z1CD73_9RHOB|nr:DUF692 domain-containing protein [Paracoccus liaowanqingii]
MVMTHLPPRAGVGFKPEHFAAIRSAPHPVSFFEIHAENYMGAGGLPHAQLTALRADHAILVHGVGLSIGGADRPDPAHLLRLRRLCNRYEPESFSEHLGWSSHGTEYLNDLLPLPYTQETVDRVCAHVDEVQDRLGRRMLLENPATYVLFAQSDIPETQFLAEIAFRTGCGLLLDINNVFVSCTNHRTDPRAYLDRFAMAAVGEIHLGGHDSEDLPSGPLLIDSHGAAVADPVWTLYAEVITRIGPRPTLVEWDSDLPAWPVLATEAARADRILTRVPAHGG